MGMLLGGAAVYFATQEPTERSIQAGNIDDEIAKWRRSSIDWETALLRHSVVDATYEPTKKYMSERIAAAEKFLADKISYEEYAKTANELDEHARNTGIIHVLNGEDFGYRMQ